MANEIMPQQADLVTQMTPINTQQPKLSMSTNDEISRALQKIDESRQPVGPVASASQYSKNLVSDNKKIIFSELLKKGYNKDFILAAMGNMQEESGFFPSRLQGDPTDQSVVKDWFKPAKARGTGLVQWDNRRNALKKFAEKKGTSWEDLQTQIDFLDSELKTTEKSAYAKIMKAKTLEEKTKLFATEFERAGTTSAKEVVRGNLTEEQRQKNLQRRVKHALTLSREFNDY